MAFVKWLITLVIKTLVSFLWGKGEDYAKERAEQVAEDKKTEARNLSAREKNEAAVTPEEREAAADEIFRNFDR